MRKYRLFPKRLAESREGAVFEELAAPPVAPFAVRRLSLEPNAAFSLCTGNCYVVIASLGNAVIKANGETLTLRQGQSLFIAAAAGQVEIITPDGQAELCLVQSAVSFRL
jgi:mannose-6-phosphate isomerase class I